MYEYEKKYMLTREEYIAFLKKIGKYASFANQTNYYFDSNDLEMNEKGITYRIRAKNKTFTAMMKMHNVGQFNCNLEETIYVKSVFDPNVFNIMGLYLQGELSTKRIILHKNDFCEIVIDHNIYLGTTDYELEIEYLKGCESKTLVLLEKIIDSLNATHQIIDKEEFFKRDIKSMSKSQRFFERLKIAGPRKAGEIYNFDFTGNKKN